MNRFIYEFWKLLYPTLQVLGIFGLMVLLYVGIPFVIATIFSLPKFMIPLLTLFIISMSISISVLIDKWSQGWFIAIVLYVLASIGLCISMLLIGGTIVGAFYLLEYYPVYLVSGVILLYLIVIGVKAYKKSKRRTTK